MNLLKCSALSLALVASHAATADEQLTDQATPRTVDPGPDRVLWSDLSEEGSLLTQVESVFRYLNSRYSAEPVITVQSIDITESAEGELGSNQGSCVHRADPGSRIIRERCVYISPEAESFEQFLVHDSIEQFRDEQDRWFIEQAEYGDTYRRSQQD